MKGKPIDDYVALEGRRMDGEFALKVYVIILLAYNLFREFLDRRLSRHGWRSKVRTFMKCLNYSGAIVILCSAAFAIWRSQIDVTESVRRFFTSRPLDSVSWLATRDPNKIYQDHQPVGDVIGSVHEVGEQVTFEKLANSGNLDPGKPFEYQRMKLKIVRMRKYIGQKMMYLDGRLQTLKDIRISVVCTKL